MRLQINSIEVEISPINDPELFEDRVFEVLNQDTRIALLSFSWKRWGILLTLKVGILSDRIRHHELVLESVDDTSIEQAIEKLLNVENMTLVQPFRQTHTPETQHGLTK